MRPPMPIYMRCPPVLPLWRVNRWSAVTFQSLRCRPLRDFAPKVSGIILPVRKVADCLTNRPSPATGHGDGGTFAGPLSRF